MRPWRNDLTSKRSLAAGGLLVVGLACLAATGVWLNRHPPQARASNPLLRELATALSTAVERPVRGRLSWLPYAAAPASVRGENRRGLAPRARIAALQIEALSSEQPSAVDPSALGSAFLVMGRWDEAVTTLEDAVTGAPDQAGLQSDLSAAYLARADAVGRAVDWARALAAATRAIGLDATRPEPYFNRALALGGLHLTVEELGAWEAVTTVDRNGPWATEAASYQRMLRNRAAEIAVESEPNWQRVRERIEDDLLRRWGQAVVSGDEGSAEPLLREAEAEAARMAAIEADGMPRDEIARIRRALVRGDRDRLRALARGHHLYGQAREKFGQDDLRPAAELMTSAATEFAKAESPYRYWAPVYWAFALRLENSAAAGLKLLESVPLAEIPANYHHLRGRLAWAAGVSHGRLGRFDLERAPLARSIDEFRSGRERDYEIAARTILAETEIYLGDHSKAWSELLAIFALAARHQRTTRDYHYGVGALLAFETGLPEAARDLLTARARVAHLPRAAAEALLWRARLEATMGNTAGASADLARASEFATRVPAGGVYDRLSGDIAIARLEWLSRFDCPRAIAQADTVYTRLLNTPHSVRIAGVLTARAKCRESLGDIAGARRDLDAAAAVFEARQEELTSAADRIQAFEWERNAFNALLALDVLTIHDEDSGFRTAERARRGALPRDRRVALDAGAWRRLPADVALVYYELLDDRVLTWVMTRHGRRLLQRPVSAATIRRWVDDIRKAIARGVNLVSLRTHAGDLVETLIAPALAAGDALSPTGHASRVFFVPDGPLFLLPFGALPDSTGQPLLQSRTVGIAPSLAGFLLASERLTTFVPTDVLAVGDGHDAGTTGLPRLPRSDGEARTVGSRYPRRLVLTGADATKARVLQRQHAVVHFAGHTVVNAEYPMYSRLLLAPDLADDDPGLLLGSDITPARFGATRVVVLASCEGAVGRLVDGEGAISIARTFFTAGVPAVVATLWPVPDDVPGFAETFHGQLVVGRDPATALAAAQRSMLDRLGPSTPVNVWGGFIVFGGLRPAE